MAIDVSVIIPMYNAAHWLEETLTSIINQTFTGSLEVSIYDDASTDGSLDIVYQLQDRLKSRGFVVTIGANQTNSPKGVGATRNKAIKQSCGRFLCFLDADDVMLPDRVKLQYDVIQSSITSSSTLIGSKFYRQPPDSTVRYTKWCNTLTSHQLYTQGYTSFGPTLIIPTWFISRELYITYGPFDERGAGIPEDLIFFYKVLSGGGTLIRVDKPLLIYRYHQHNITFTIKEETIWELRVQALQDNVLFKWTHFTIWNAGKQGRRFYRSLKLDNQNKVEAFCDVDVKKTSKGIYIYEESDEPVKPRVPIVHFKEARPPFIICVKWELTGGDFEKNLKSLDLTEGQDYYNFS